MKNDSVQLVVSTLRTVGNALCEAIEKDSHAREALRKARFSYEIAESAALVDAHNNATGKNAEARKAEVDHVIAWERVEGGCLEEYWNRLQVATEIANSAARELEQARIQYSIAKMEARLTAVIWEDTEV